MTDDRSPPPEVACLSCPCPSSQKGGTLIAEDVTSLQMHQRLLRCPDGYRPKECKRCDCKSVHIHSYRLRMLAAEPARSTVVVCFRCSNSECGAVWRVLPALLARRLWRSWQVVETATMADASAASSPVPGRTRRRWKQRLSTAARSLLTALASSADAVIQRLAGSVADAASRLELVVAHARATGCSDGRRLSSLAALIHRLAPGIRVM